MCGQVAFQQTPEPAEEKCTEAQVHRGRLEALNPLLSPEASITPSRGTGAPPLQVFKGSGPSGSQPSPW